MSEQANQGQHGTNVPEATASPDSTSPLAIVIGELRAKFDSSRVALEQAVRYVVDCKNTHRRHTVFWKGLDPARQILKEQGLPKQLWVSTVGAFLMDTLEQLITLDQDVHIQRAAIARLDSDLLLLLHIRADGPSQAEPARLDDLAARLDDQLLIDLREETLLHLKTLLRDTDLVTVQERETLREVLVSFIETQIELAVTEAGYHVVPNTREIHPGEMLAQADVCVASARTRLSEERTLRQGERARINLNLDRAIAMVLLSFPHFAKQRAHHLDGSTIAGRLSFLQQCVDALEPGEVNEALPRGMAYRAKYAHERMTKEVTTRIEQFRRDLERSIRDIGKAVDTMDEASRLKLRLKEVRCLP